MIIRYVNTDLDLLGPRDLTALAATFERLGLHPLHLTRGDNGLWRATFETATQHEEPEATIGEMLAAIEALTAPITNDWRACTLREFNVAYDCGDGPWAFNQGLSVQLLRRTVDAGVALRITLYPEDRESRA